MRTADGFVAADATLPVIIPVAHTEIMVARRIGRPPVKPHAHPHPPDNQVVRPRRIQWRRAVAQDIGHQAAAERHQLTDGIAAVNHRDRCLRHSIENFASPLVHEMRRRNDQDRFARIAVLHQRRDADAHHRLAGTHLTVEEYRRQAVTDQPGIDGMNALFLRGKGLPLQPGEDVVLPGRMFATIDHRCLRFDLFEQLGAVVAEESGKRDDLAAGRIFIRRLWRTVPVEDDLLC